MINQTTTKPPDFPEHLWNGFKRYVLQGRPTGQFLQALCAGELFEVFRRGDELSIAGLRPMIMFLENQCPIGCFGSRRNVQEWCEQGGLEGLQKE
jgi:hypothetical protein